MFAFVCLKYFSGEKYFFSSALEYETQALNIIEQGRLNTSSLPRSFPRQLEIYPYHERVLIRGAFHVYSFWWRFSFFCCFAIILRHSTKNVEFIIGVCIGFQYMKYATFVLLIEFSCRLWIAGQEKSEAIELIRRDYELLSVGPLNSFLIKAFATISRRQKMTL